jgi:hypothetical protein
MILKCKKCKKDFDKSQLTTVRQANGVYAKGVAGYCRPCELEQYQRNMLVDYIHRLFIYKGYYNDPKIDKSKANRNEINRLMKMINSQIKSLCESNFTYEQIRLILDYMLTRESIEFSDSIMGLVPYYYVRTSKHYNDLYRIGTQKSYGSIPAPVEERITRPAHKPKAVQKISIDML